MSKAPDLVDLLDDLVDPEIEKILDSGKYPRGPLATTEYPPTDKLTPLQKAMRASPPSHEKRHAGVLTEQVYSKHSPDIVAKFRHMIENEGKIPEHAQTKK